MTKKPVRLLHTDFAAIVKGPCVRESLLWSLNLGVGATLTRFMMTSNLRKSFVFGVLFGQASFLAILISCRIRLIRERTEIYQLEPAFKSYRELYGTDKGKLKKIEEDDVPVNDKL